MGISLLGSRELGPAKVRGRVILLSPASQTPFQSSEPRHLGRVRLVRATSVCLHSTCISSIKGFLRHLSNARLLLSGDLFSDCMYIMMSALQIVRFLKLSVYCSA